MMLMLVAMLSMTFASAKIVTTSFKVAGNGSKAHIEAAAKSVKGVRRATFLSSRRLTVTYDNRLTTVRNIRNTVNRCSRMGTNKQGKCTSCKYMKQNRGKQSAAGQKNQNNGQKNQGNNQKGNSDSKGKVSKSNNQDQSKS